MRRFCIECTKEIPEQVYHKSKELFGFPLCFDHQKWYKYKNHETTRQTIALYLALRKNGIDARLEFIDEYEIIAIVVQKSRVKIEVDGLQLNQNADQAFFGLQRTWNSFKNGYVTFRIPASLVNGKLSESVNIIIKMIDQSRINLTEG